MVFLYFRKWNFLAPSLKSILYFRRELSKFKKLKKPTLKKFLIFQGMELLSSKVKKLLCFFRKSFFYHFRRELVKSEKQKFLIFGEMELSS